MRLLFIFTLITLAFTTNAQSDTTKLTTYKKDIYRIEYPVSWEFGLDSTDNKLSGFTIFSPRKVNEQRVYISLSIIDLKGKYSSLPNYVSDVVYKIQHSPLTHTNGTIYDSKKVKTDNAEYYIVNYGETVGSYEMKIMGYYFYKDAKGYELTYNALSKEYFEKLKPAAERILKSFRLAE